MSAGRSQRKAVYFNVKVWFLTAPEGGLMARITVMMFALLGAASLSWAQDFRGGITGRIVDSSGARMPGVTVTAVNAATNVPSTTITNGDGDYAILFLNPGRYALTAELQGFKKIVR